MQPALIHLSSPYPIICIYLSGLHNYQLVIMEWTAKWAK